MQERYHRLRSDDDRAQTLPTFKLTADCFARWRASGRDGRRQLEAAYDRVVIDLVDKHRIVAKDLGQGLKDWLNDAIAIYFENRSSYSRELTDKQALDCERKIAELGERLRDELARLYGLETTLGIFWHDATETHVARDVGELARILSRAKQMPRWRSITQKDNASKRALHQLGDNICWFWVTGWTGRLAQTWDQKPPVISKSSDYFRFAKYIYTLICEERSDRMIVERLRAAERNFALLDGDFFSRYRSAAEAYIKNIAKVAAQREAALGHVD